MKIRQVAFVKACCLRGFRHFFVCGPLTWFLLIYLYGITLGILRGKPPAMSRLILSFIVAVVAAFGVGEIVFSIFQWRIRKWDQDLAGNEMQKVRETLDTLHPFRDISAFIILFMIFFSIVRFIFVW